MAKMMTRTVSDLVAFAERERSNIAFDLGATVSAAYDMPMETGLLANQLSLLTSRDKVEDPIARREKLRARERDAENARTIRQLADQMDHTYNQNDKDVLRSQINDLRNQGTQIEAWRLKQVDAGALRDPKELEEEYKDIGMTFDRPMSQEEVDERVDIRRADLVRQEIIARGPTGAGAFLAQAGASLAKAATDPLAIASAFIPVVSQAKTAALMERFGRVKGRALVGGIEGTVGAAIVEPLVYGLSKEQQIDYEFTDSMLNVGLGGIFGLGIGSLAGRLSRANPATDTKAKIDTNTKENVGDERLPEVEAERAEVIGPEEVPEVKRTVVESLQQRAELALAQVVNGVRVNTEILGTMLPTRPRTLVEAIRKLGGVNNTVGLNKNAGDISPRRANNNAGVINQDSQLSMQDMAIQMHKEGYITAPTVKKLAAAINGELKGKHRFRAADREMVDKAMKFYGAKNYDELLNMEAAALKADAEAIDVEITPDQIHDVAVARIAGASTDEAYASVGIDAVIARARAAAKYASDPANRFDAADPEDEIDFTPSDDTVTAQQDVDELELYFNDLNDTEGLTDVEKAEIQAELESESAVTTRQKIIKSAASCIARETDG
tara:strand:- start:424 stop:2259 length:1836 start_codon:yes stop_codon:yes gene_type:complete